jgi:hypothetical protein
MVAGYHAVISHLQRPAVVPSLNAAIKGSKNSTLHIHSNVAPGFNRGMMMKLPLQAKVAGYRLGRK